MLSILGHALFTYFVLGRFHFINPFRCLFFIFGASSLLSLLEVWLTALLFPTTAGNCDCARNFPYYKGCEEILIIDLAL